MRTCLLALLVVGCSGKSMQGDDMPPDPKGWTITVDMSRLDRYVPVGTTTWTVDGKATATEGLASIEVNGAPATFRDDGVFAQSVSVMPGTTRVPVMVRDQAGHERKGTRTLMSTAFLPDGAHNPGAAGLVLDNAILASMSSGIAGQAGDVDIAGEIMMKQVLSQDDRCVTWPTAATQGAVRVELTQDQGTLWLHITVPSLDVRFGGQCQGLLSTIPIAGRMAGTIHVWTKLGAQAPERGEACVTAFTHTLPDVQVSGWQFDVWGVGGPLQNWIVDRFSGDKSAEAKAQIQSEVKTRAHAMLGEKLQNVSVFDKTSELSLLDKPVSLHLCLGALDKVGQQLIARVAAAATGDGERTAPGAPMIDGAAIDPAAKELVLDANLVAQLLFASWRGGGLARMATDVDIGVLQILIPPLYDRWPDATAAQVSIDAELPPIVRTSTTNDITIELPDLMVTLSVEKTAILRFNVSLVLVLDLVPAAGKLMPKVVDTKAEVDLIDELYDGNDAALEQAVQSQIGNAASGLLGDSAAIALPDLPGLGAPIDVAPAMGGRYLRIEMM